MTPNDNAHEPQPAISAEGAEPTFGRGLSHDFEFAAFRAGITYDQALSAGKALLERGWPTPVGLTKPETMRLLHEQPEGAESVALPPLDVERVWVHSSPNIGMEMVSGADYDTVWRALRAQIAANARLGAERDEANLREGRAIIEIGIIHKRLVTRAERAEADLAAAQAGLAQMKGEA